MKFVLDRRRLSKYGYKTGSQIEDTHFHFSFLNYKIRGASLQGKRVGFELHKNHMIISNNYLGTRLSDGCKTVVNSPFGERYRNRFVDDLFIAICKVTFLSVTLENFQN